MTFDEALEVFSPSLFEIGEAMWKHPDFPNSDFVRAFERMRVAQKIGRHIPRKVYLAVSLLGIVPTWPEWIDNPIHVNGESAFFMAHLETYLGQKKVKAPTTALTFLSLHKENDMRVRLALTKWEKDDITPTPELCSYYWNDLTWSKPDERCFKLEYANKYMVLPRSDSLDEFMYEQERMLMEQEAMAI